MPTRSMRPAKAFACRILFFEDVRENAAALQDGRADLAVVRPDVLLPIRGTGSPSVDQAVADPRDGHRSSRSSPQTGCGAADIPA